MTGPGRTMLDKIWDAHFVARRADGRELIYIDRHVLHELHAPHAFEKLEAAPRRAPPRSDLFDAGSHGRHQARPRRDHQSDGAPFHRAMREGSRQNGIRVFDLDDPEQGISHVVAPELGMVLPGATHAVPDSHACTVGGLGALAFGCGTTELAHILATQVIALKRPKRMRVRLDGKLAPHVTAKDVALQNHRADRRRPARAATSSNIAGAAARAMPIEQRMTLCNLTIEMGARSGFVAPDDTTFHGSRAGPTRRRAPCGTARSRTGAHCKTDDDAVFDRELTVDCTALGAANHLGHRPEPGARHRRSRARSAGRRRQAASRRWRARSPTWGCSPAWRSPGLKVNRVFIGSCTNARLPDLQVAADIVRGRTRRRRRDRHGGAGLDHREARGGSRGLDRVFRDAGFFWGESGCSMCAGGNGDRGEPGDRIVSTTNRNFEHRQGTGVRTHLVSPATAAAPRSRAASPMCGRCRERADAALHLPHRHCRSASRGRHQHRPDRAGAGDARPEARLQEAAVHARAPPRRRQRGSGLRPQQAAVPQSRHPGRAGHNFGAGSSREAAVWGMLANNIRVIVAQELRRHLSRELPAERLAAGRAADRPTPTPSSRASSRRTARRRSRSICDASASAGPGGPDLAFEIPPADRMRLLEGLDDIGLTLQAHRRDRRVREAHGGHSAVAAEGEG